MRIRKHAKISPLLYTASSLQHTTICQLNQSPWDVITFSPDEYLTPATTTPPPPPPPPPPLHHQVEQENVFQGNGSFSDSIGALESDNVAATEGAKSDFIDVEMEEAKPESSREQVGKMVEEETFCSKIDSKGWQCHRIAKSGYTLCEHHLSRLTRYNGFNNLAQENGTRESDKSIEHRRRGRPKKPSASMD
ncbi:hypothetical protein Leryth_007190 [Lithospermum erythrorhizon]|nr:hypothetical protein Leryth_007190 [Lithospermum erythrorhizon]